MKTKPSTGWLCRRVDGRFRPLDYADAGRIYLQLRQGTTVTRISLGTEDAGRARELARLITAPLAADGVGLADALARAADRLGRAPAAGPALPLAAAWDAYVASKRRPRSGPTTLRHYSSRWAAFVTFASKQAALLADMTPALAEQYVAHLEADGLSARTIGTHLQALRLVWATVGPRAPCPFAGVRTQAPDTLTPHRRLTHAECCALYAACPGELRALVAIGYTTGLRLYDCVHLRREAYDAGRRVLTVQPRKSSQIRLSLTIPVLPFLAEHLTPGRGYVLPGLRRHYDGVDGAISKRIAAVMDTAGIRSTTAGRASFHSLRKTFVTMMDEAGAPGRVTDSVTGHGATGDMHARYSQVDVESARVWMERAIVALATS